MDHIDQLVKAKLIENISIINKVISCAPKSKFNIDYIAYHTQFRMATPLFPTYLYQQF